MGLEMECRGLDRGFWREEKEKKKNHQIEADYFGLNDTATGKCLQNDTGPESIVLEMAGYRFLFCFFKALIIEQLCFMLVDT